MKPEHREERQPEVATAARPRESQPDADQSLEERTWETLLHGIASRYGESPNGIATGLARLPQSSQMPILRLVAARYGNHAMTMVIAAIASQKAGVTAEAPPSKAEAAARDHATAHIDGNRVFDQMREGMDKLPEAGETWSRGLRGASTGDITQSPSPIIQSGALPAAQGAIETAKAMGHAIANPRETWRRFSESVARSYDEGGGGLIGVLYAIGEHNPVTVAEEQVSSLLEAVADGDYKRASHILGGFGIGAALAWGFSKVLGRFIKKKGAGASAAAEEAATEPPPAKVLEEVEAQQVANAPEGAAPETSSDPVPDRTDLSQPGGLASTEGRVIKPPKGKPTGPSHPLGKHGPHLSDEYLRGRLKDPKFPIPEATKFIDRSTMEAVIGDALKKYRSEIEAWLADPKGVGRKSWDYSPGRGNLGRGMKNVAGEPVLVTSGYERVKVVLQRDYQGGFIIYTAHPMP